MVASLRDARVSERLVHVGGPNSPALGCRHRHSARPGTHRLRRRPTSHPHRHQPRPARHRDGRPQRHHRGEGRGSARDRPAHRPEARPESRHVRNQAHRWRRRAGAFYRQVHPQPRRQGHRASQARAGRNRRGEERPDRIRRSHVRRQDVPPLAGRDRNGAQAGAAWGGHAGVFGARDTRIGGRCRSDDFSADAGTRGVRHRRQSPGQAHLDGCAGDLATAPLVGGAGSSRGNQAGHCAQPGLRLLDQSPPRRWQRNRRAPDARTASQLPP